MHQKLAPDLFLIFLNNLKQPLDTRNSLKIRYFERELSKSLKKVKFIFLPNPVPLMDKVTKNKRVLELVTSHSSGHKTSSEKFLYLLYII